MSVERLQFRMGIEASPEVVWDVMLSAEGYARWTKPFAEGSYFEGSWTQGWPKALEELKQICEGRSRRDRP